MRGTQEAWLVGHSMTWACLSHKAGRWCWWFVISDLKRVVSSTHACGIERQAVSIHLQMTLQKNKVAGTWSQHSTDCGQRRSMAPT